MVCVTPAFASQMSDIAKSSEDFHNRCEQVFKHDGDLFQRIALLWEAGDLLIKVTKTPKDHPKDYSENIDDLYDRSVLSQDNMHLLVDYRNSPIQSETSVNEKTENNTNKTNESSNTTASSTTGSSESKKSSSALKSSVNNNQINDNTYFKEMAAPQVCSDDANNVINYFASQSIAVNKISQKEVDESLIGNVAQFVDKKGYLRYVYVKNVRNNTVTFVSNDGKLISMSSETFAKGYTGILLSSDGDISPEKMVNSINDMQKGILDSDISKANSQKDLAFWYLMASAALFIAGVLTLIIGLIITGLSSNFEEIDPMATGVISDRNAGKYYRMTEYNDPMYKHSPYFVPFHGNELQKRAQMLKTVKLGLSIFTFTDEELFESLEANGVSLVAINALQSAWYGFQQNWVKVILLGIGIIFVIAGIAFLLAAVGFTVWACISIIMANLILDATGDKIKDRDEWLNMVNETNSTNATNVTNTSFSSALSNGSVSA